MLNFVRKLFDHDPGPPPAPDVKEVPTFPAETVVEAVYSEDYKHRAIITCDQSGLYRIHVQYWDTSDWARGYGANWMGCRGGPMTDTIENAEKLAREEIVNGTIAKK